MEKIAIDKDFESAVSELNDVKKQFKKTFLGNAGIIIGVFLALVGSLTMLTDIKITSFGDVANLSMRYFVLLFVSYQMYVNTSDSGARRGLLSEAYTSSRDKYFGLKDKVIAGGLQGKLPTFCAEYIKRELKNTRTVIVATIGMSYEEFEEYLSRDEESVKNDKTLSKVQRKTIIKAMKVVPIKLTPDMIMQAGARGNRSPLGVNPHRKKAAVFGTKFLTTAFTTIFVASLAFEIVAAPTVETVLYTLTSIVPMVLNGFTGYKFGYENIVFDTVNYTDAQSSVIEEFLKETQNGDKIECADEARV